MKEDTKKRLSQLILDELSEKIRSHETLRKKLETFTDLPVEKVADAILNQFEYLLSSDLRELIVYLIQQDATGGQTTTSPASGEESVKAPEEIPAPAVSAAPEVEEASIPPQKEEPVVPEPVPLQVEEDVIQGSIMQHFNSRESFPTTALDGSEFQRTDWFYLCCFSYAPDSSGKGIPSKKLLMKGIDSASDLFVLDYGDVRFFLHRLNTSELLNDTSGRPSAPPSKIHALKYEHEQILNIIRTDEVIVSLPFWTIVNGLDELIRRIEDRYVELLRALIDIHDASEWDVEVLAFDQHIASLPSMAELAAGRSVQRETKHQTSKGRNVKVLEKMTIREKNIAQDIYSKLLVAANKGKVDFIIRLDNAFIDDWKSILSARYTVGKDRRRSFCNAVRSAQQSYAEFRLMFRITNPGVRFTLPG
jgi:hypothetical protein